MLEPVRPAGLQLLEILSSLLPQVQRLLLFANQENPFRRSRVIQHAVQRPGEIVALELGQA